jgi:hypothetical protein
VQCRSEVNPVKKVLIKRDVGQERLVRHSGQGLGASPKLRAPCFENHRGCLTFGTNGMEAIPGGPLQMGRVERYNPCKFLCKSFIFLVLLNKGIMVHVGARGPVTGCLEFTVLEVILLG